MERKRQTHNVQPNHKGRGTCESKQDTAKRSRPQRDNMLTRHTQASSDRLHELWEIEAESNNYVICCGKMRYYGNVEQKFTLHTHEVCYAENIVRMSY